MQMKQEQITNSILSKTDLYSVFLHGSKPVYIRLQTWERESTMLVVSLKIDHLKGREHLFHDLKQTQKTANPKNTILYNSTKCPLDNSLVVTILMKQIMGFVAG